MDAPVYHNSQDKQFSSKWPAHRLSMLNMLCESSRQHLWTISSAEDLLRTAMRDARPPQILSRYVSPHFSLKLCTRILIEYVDSFFLAFKIIDTDGV